MVCFVKKIPPGFQWNSICPVESFYKKRISLEDGVRMQRILTTSFFSLVQTYSNSKNSCVADSSFVTPATVDPFPEIFFIRTGSLSLSDSGFTATLSKSV